MKEEVRKRVLENLKGMGYFKFVPKENLDEVEIAINRDFENGVIGDSFELYEANDGLYSVDYRIYHADAENLSESGFEDLINTMRHTLNKEGVKLRKILNVSIKGTYHYAIKIDGNTYEINPKSERLEWDVAQIKLVEILNDLLQKAGSQERAYTYLGGNDAKVFFLTKQMFDYIKSSGHFKNGCFLFSLEEMSDQ